VLDLERRHRLEVEERRERRHGLERHRGVVCLEVGDSAPAVGAGVARLEIARRPSAREELQ
jgi:hypothetical protein